MALSDTAILAVHRRNQLDKGLEDLAQPFGQVFWTAVREALGSTLGQAMPKPFDDAAHRIDQGCSDFHKFAPCPEEGQITLLGQIAVPDRVEKLGVETSEPRQGLGVLGVVLPIAAPNGRNLARVRNESPRDQSW